MKTVRTFMETMSAMPIEDKVAMVLVKVAREGIIAIQNGDEIILINKKRKKQICCLLRRS